MRWRSEEVDRVLVEVAIAVELFFYQYSESGSAYVLRYYVEFSPREINE